LKFFWALFNKLGGQIFDHLVWRPKTINSFCHTSTIEGDQKLMNKFFNIAKNLMGIIKTNSIIGSITIVDWMIKILQVDF